MAAERQLPLLSEKALPYAIRPHLLAYCSRTDLFAIATQDEIIEVYRLGGQRAFSVKRKSPQTTIVGLQWIRNGKCLAVALSSGYVDIVSGESGKIIRHGGDDPFSTDAADSKPDRGAITCLGWGTVLTKSTPKSKAQSNEDHDDLTTDEWFNNLQQKRNNALLVEDDTEIREQKASLNDLPRQLAFMDVESVLPRLSPIPTRHGASGRYDMFATQAALDDYFDSMQRKDRLAADVMFVGHSGGKHRVIVDDILEIKHAPGQPRLGGEEMTDAQASLVPLLYASHARSKQHALLRVEPSDQISSKEDHRNVFLTLFDIPLMASGGSHLHLIASRTAELRDLCGYISYSILCAKSDWNTHTNLPSRFMENVNETLEEKGEGTLEQNLYHLAMTGDFSPTILEWLRDELAERGHKRWDHATATLHTDLSKILLTNLLPVLERSAVVATNLRGLAQYYTDSTNFSVSPSVFTTILSTLSNLQLLVHEAVQILGVEQRQFRAFSKWLRHQIDLAAADPTSVSARDLAERENPHLDLGNVLAYLEGALTKSRLKPIIRDAPAPATETEGVDPPSMQDLVKELHAVRKGQDATALSSLQQWSLYLSAACKDAHTHISAWQHATQPHTRNLLCKTANTKSPSPLLDVRMVETVTGTFETFVLGIPAPNTSSSACQIAIWHTTSSDPSQTEDQELQNPHLYTFPTSSKVQSLIFLDNETYLAILDHENSSYLLCLPYNGPTHESQVQESRTWQDLAPFVAHTFDAKQGFKPGSLRVNGRKGRRSAVVVAEDLRGWKVLDLEGFRMFGGGGGGLAGDEGSGDGDSIMLEGEDSMVID